MTECIVKLFLEWKKVPIFGTIKLHSKIIRLCSKLEAETIFGNIYKNNFHLKTKKHIYWWSIFKIVLKRLTGNPFDIFFSKKLQKISGNLPGFSGQFYGFFRKNTSKIYNLMTKALKMRFYFLYFNWCFRIFYRI